MAALNCLKVQPSTKVTLNLMLSPRPILKRMVARLDPGEKSYTPAFNFFP